MPRKRRKLNRFAKEAIFLSREKLRKQNKIRDRFKKQRKESITFAQKKLFEYLKFSRNGDFKTSLEREIYTKEGVRFSDIFIKKHGLSIEIDGEHHFTEEQTLKDSAREKEIWDKKRIITIRVTNDEIINDFESTTKRIDNLINKLDVPPLWGARKGKNWNIKNTMDRKKIWKNWSEEYYRKNKIRMLC